ncbi:MAG: sigma factor-like helix-turn-helix DNA-binding protein [Candidatus Promineifilaceae bacterium]
MSTKQQQKTLELAYFDGKTRKEIAEQTQTPLGTCTYAGA